MGYNSGHKQVFMIDGKTDRQVVNQRSLPSFFIYIELVPKNSSSNCGLTAAFQGKSCSEEPFLAPKNFNRKVIAVEKKSLNGTESFHNSLLFA